MRSAAPTPRELGGGVESLEKWFLDQAQTPAGSLLLFVLIFVTRVSIDQYTAKRAAKRHHKRKAV